MTSPKTAAKEIIECFFASQKPINEPIFIHQLSSSVPLIAKRYLEAVEQIKQLKLLITLSPNADFKIITKELTDTSLQMINKFLSDHEGNQQLPTEEGK